MADDPSMHDERRMRTFEVTYRCSFDGMIEHTFVRATTVAEANASAKEKFALRDHGRNGYRASEILVTREA